MKYTEVNVAICGRKITSALLIAQEYNTVVVVMWHYGVNMTQNRNGRTTIFVKLRHIYKAELGK